MNKRTGMSREVRECLAEMGVTEEVFAKIRSASNHTDGERLLDEAKEICRKGFRTVARLYHPDLNEHLPPNERKTKEERFKRLRSVYDSFLESRYRGPRRSNTQMGANNFDPFGFYSADSAFEDVLRSLRKDHRSSNPADIVDQLKEEGRRRAKIRMAYDILNQDFPKKTPPPPTPPPPKPAPPPPMGTSPITMPHGVWHRDEASCQPQIKPQRKKTTP